MPTSSQHRPARALGLATAGALCAAAIAACGSSTGNSTTATTPGSSPTSSMPKSDSPSMGSHPGHMDQMPGMKGMIMIEDFAFTSPQSVAPGASVMVMNADSEAHSVTADDGAFDVTVQPGRTATLTAPDKPGSYPFHCMFHSTMTGMLRVR